MDEAASGFCLSEARNVLLELCEVSPVGLKRVGRQAALNPQLAEISFGKRI
jgi:hypothetical protein